MAESVTETHTKLKLKNLCIQVGFLKRTPPNKINVHLSSAVWAKPQKTTTTSLWSGFYLVRKEVNKEMQIGALTLPTNDYTTISMISLTGRPKKKINKKKSLSSPSFRMSQCKQHFRRTINTQGCTVPVSICLMPNQLQLWRNLERQTFYTEGQIPCMRWEVGENDGGMEGGWGRWRITVCVCVHRLQDH